MEEKILAIMKEIRNDIDFEKETALIDDKVLDSFDIVSLISELNDTFDIEIGIDDMTNENFNSLSAVRKMVEHLLDGD